MITSICMHIINITCDKDKVNEMKLHTLLLMDAWMMLVLMKCKCQMQCLTLGCNNFHALFQVILKFIMKDNHRQHLAREEEATAVRGLVRQQAMVEIGKSMTLGMLTARVEEGRMPGVGRGCCRLNTTSLADSSDRLTGGLKVMIER